MTYFHYTQKQLNDLKDKDSKLKEVIDKVGYIKREVDTDIFSSVIHHIISQQISTKAQLTIWNRLNNLVKELNPNNVLKLTDEQLQSIGIANKKAIWIKDFCLKVQDASFDIEALKEMDDEECIQQLTSLKGVGRWTAEMILLFSMNRMNILAYDDLIIQRGLRMIYHHRKITKSLFEKYKRRFTPYGSIASLYIWEVGNGKVEGYKDYASK